MKKDIEFPHVTGVHVGITQDSEGFWEVFLINDNDFVLQNILITSTGYLAEDDNPKKMQQQTSTLRHAVPILQANEYAKIEMIDAEVFHLCNEYWISYYVDGKIYDKKFIFMPNTISKENFVYIENLEKEGVLHS